MMPRDRTLPLTVLDSEGIVEACRQTFSLWGSGYGFPAYVDRIREAFRRMGAAMRYVGIRESSGGLAASARELDGEFVVDGQPRRFLGIAAVFTREDVRGNGYGRALVRSLIRDAVDRGASAALLFSDIDPAFYRDLGFVQLPALDWHAPVELLPATTSVALRRATPDDEPAMRAWFHEANRGRELSLMRSPTWWRYFRWWRDAGEEYILSAGHGDVGYLNARLRGDRLHVYEWAAPGVPAEDVWGAVRARAADLRASSVGGWLRADQAERWMNVTERSAAIPMIRVLDPTVRIPVPEEVTFDELDHF